jgi:hypothetical protein
MNAQQIEGWALDRQVRTQSGERAFGFFTSKEVADAEAARLSTMLEPVKAVPATLILPPLPATE